MQQALLVGAGGFLGAIARYLLGSGLTAAAGHPRFPVGTLAVNLIGCCLIGLLAGLGESRQLLTPESRLFLITGVLGGFTTFSTFGLESYSLIRAGAWIAVTLNIVLSVGVGILGVWAGFRVTR